jgi:DNA-binding MarR family transcriptional regulator
MANRVPTDELRPACAAGTVPGRGSGDAPLPDPDTLRSVAPDRVLRRLHRVNCTEFLLLDALARSAPARRRARELAECTGRTPASAWVALQALESLGLVCRQRSVSDDRQRFVSLTEAGWRVWAAARASILELASGAAARRLTHAQ